LLKDKKITLAKAAELKDQYAKLYNTLRVVQRNETFHLQQAARMQEELKVLVVIEASNFTTR
jgi:hypothetical protein